MRQIVGGAGKGVPHINYMPQPLEWNTSPGPSPAPISLPKSRRLGM